MESHIKVARAHRALSWLYGFVAALCVFVVIASIQRGASTPVLAPLFVMLIIILGIATLHYVTAKGARDLKPWANTTSRVIAILMLFGFPVGTLIGIYLLSNSDWRVTPKRTGSLADAWPAETETAGGS
jgi:hypothetical protein